MVVEVEVEMEGALLRISFFGTARTLLVFICHSAICVRVVSLQISYFFQSFFFFLVAGFSFTWREINLKFKCAPSKMGKNVFDDDDDDDDCVRWRWEHVFLHGKVF